jgi:AcrR family transcriptional regulator
VEPQTKSARTRARILDAAAVVFSRQGYGARLSDIAERAGIQTGSLYYHFESREALVAEVLRMGIETSWQAVRAAVESMGPGVTHVDRLAAAVRAHTMSVLSIGHYASAQARIVGHVPKAVSEEHRRDQRRYGDYWNELLRAASEAGELRPDVDLFAARMLAFGAMNWTSDWFGHQRNVGAAAVADTAVIMLLGGIVADPSSLVAAGAVRRVG